MGSTAVTTRGTRLLIMSYSQYTELGFQINNVTFAVRIPSVKIRRPRFWRKKMSVNNQEDGIATLSASSSTSSSSSSSSPPSDDWIAQFHARYNPIQTATINTVTMMSDNPSPCLTSTPVRLSRERSRITLHDVSGVKIYEDMDDIGEASENTSEDSYEIVAVENNRVIGKATFGTYSRGTLKSRIH